MNKVLIFLVVTVSFFMISCEKEAVDNSGDVDIESIYKLNKDKITISQGVSGTLIMIEGNCMPTFDTDRTKSTCRTFPIKRRIQLYKYTLPTDVVGYYSSLYDSINTSLVAETESDEEGFYQFQVDSGCYSMFILEEGKFYASGQDLQGGICPVHVLKNTITDKNLKIDHAAY